MSSASDKDEGWQARMSIDGTMDVTMTPERHSRWGAALGRARNRIMLARMALFGLLLLSMAAILFLTLRADRTDDWVEHTLRVRSEIESLLGSLREAEGAQRGYLLTGDQTYLNPYRPAVALLPDQVQKLHDLLSDSPGQTARLDAANALIRQRLDQMDETIELFAAGQQAAARAQVEQQGRTISNGIVQQLRELDAEEVRHLAQRQAQQRRNRNLLLLAITASLLATAGLATAILRAERLHIAELNQTNASLEMRVRERTAELDIERQRAEALLSDVNHRVGNNLSMVSSILALQARQSDNEEAKAVLDGAREHIGAIASAQRRLHLLAGRDWVRLDGYLEPLVEDLQELSAGKPITLKLEAEPFQLPSKDAVSIGIIVNELVTNAIKYAFPDGENGEILIRSYAVEEPDKGCVIEIVDNGIGYALDQSDGPGLGRVIVSSMSRSLGAEMEATPAAPGGQRPGAKHRLFVPRKATPPATA
ncbi:two-component sensor histidine kinase [Rhodopseudomonas julia]|uniref:histidine kinase n=1 Tax=Rhodopseudomonas julia TaxID=200617 RepID=A0ABU0C859_9BRAD|nr:CHASE3 domain-containing protein [Rhodopseudomonas julia]MDQ0326701.1 two-component sensor histidine kinase [Rhodopseudomonas julia]